MSLIALLAASSQAGAATTNLLLDGGFESGGLGWQTFPQPGVTVNIANCSNSTAHDGTHYREANTSADSGSIYQDVPVNMTAGQSATFSAWVRIPAGVPLRGQAANLCPRALTQFYMFGRNNFSFDGATPGRPADG